MYLEIRACNKLLVGQLISIHTVSYIIIENHYKPCSGSAISTLILL